MISLIFYGYLLLLMVYLLYNGINIAAGRLLGTEGAVVLGVEPILFGVFCLGFDLLLIQGKGALRRMLRNVAPKTTSGYPFNSAEQTVKVGC